MEETTPLNKYKTALVKPLTVSSESSFWEYQWVRERIGSPKIINYTFPTLDTYRKHKIESNQACYKVP